MMGMNRNQPLRLPSVFELLESRQLLAAQTPFGSASPVAVPATIEAENFDNGGEGVADHIVAALQRGCKYCTNVGLAIETSPRASHGFNLGVVRVGEWLEYTITVKAPGTCTIERR